MTPPITDHFRQFAADIVARRIDDLCDYDAAEQTQRAVKALERFHSFTPLTPAEPGLMVDIAGFGEARVVFTADDTRYVVLTEAAEALGMTRWAACDWARKQHLSAIEDQREADEERGEGVLGWELLTDYCDLNLWLITENPEATPDAGGKRWSDYGEWLISDDRLIPLILDSPWADEFMSSAMPLFAHGAKKFFSEEAKNIPVIRIDADGNATPATFEDMFHTDLTEDEARRQARRGPNIPMEGE